jgi:hypothetical protein
MRVEHHLLRLARIGPDVDRPRRAQPHLGHLHSHRLASDLYILVTPVELVGLAGLEHERDEGRGAVARILAPRFRPAPGVATNRVVGSLKPLTAQKIMDPGHAEPIAPVPGLVLRQQHIEPLLKRPKPRQRLNRAAIIECAFRRPDRLAHHLARQPQIPRYRLDRLPARVLPPYPNNRLHRQHPDLTTWKTRQSATPSE